MMHIMQRGEQCVIHSPFCLNDLFSLGIVHEVARDEAALREESLAFAKVVAKKSPLVNQRTVRVLKQELYIKTIRSLIGPEWDRNSRALA